jgi:hypothetical protein
MKGAQAWMDVQRIVIYRGCHHCRAGLPAYRPPQPLAAPSRVPERQAGRTGKGLLPSCATSIVIQPAGHHEHHHNASTATLLSIHTYPRLSFPHLYYGPVFPAGGPPAITSRVWHHRPWFRGPLDDDIASTKVVGPK